MKIIKISIIFVLAANALLWAGCSTYQHNAQWEFKNITVVGGLPDQNPELNRLGKQGWVIVGFDHESGDSQHNEYYRYVLKHRIN